MKPAVFVMTDVVGSTALWEVHGDAMRSALEVHDGLVHGAVEFAGGRVFKHTGDGIVLVRPRSGLVLPRARTCGG